MHVYSKMKFVLCIKMYLFVCSILFLQAEQLRQHYMTKYDSEVADAYRNLQPVLQNGKELKRKVSKKKTFDIYQ